MITQAILSAVLLCAAAYLARHIFSRKGDFSLRSTRPVVAGRSGWLSEAPDGRKWGHWKPSTFRMPVITPRTDFDIETTLPPLYRAFKYKHTVVMDAKAMQWDDWIELDNQFPRYYALRKQRLEERGKKLYGTLPGAEKAAEELCLEMGEYLSARYPMVYSVERRTGKAGSWFNEPNEIRLIKIKPLGVEFDLDKEDPMMVAGLLTPVDLAIMMEGEDSLYYMRGGCIALAGSWRYEDKIGRDLYAIHTTGEVPECITRSCSLRALASGTVDRFSLRCTSDPLIADYTIVIDSGKDELAWSESTKGPEDHFDQATKGPHPDSLSAGTFKAPVPTTDPTKIQIRQERQTLRRLPRTGAIIFTVHSYTEPILDIIKEPGVAGRLASVVSSWKGEVDLHKNGSLYKDLLVPWLSKIHAEQVEQGLTPAGPDPAYRYPY